MPKVYGFTGYGGIEVQEFWDQPKPAPGPGELLIAVRAAGSTRPTGRSARAT